MAIGSTTTGYFILTNAAPIGGSAFGLIGGGVGLIHHIKTEQYDQIPLDILMMVAGGRQAYRVCQGYSSYTSSINNPVVGGTSKTVTYSPANPHPTLSKDVQNSFSGGTFTQKVLTEDTTFYRVYGGSADKVGRYMTRTPQNGGMQSQVDLALNPQWGNTAQYVTKVTVPKGTVIYEGTAAPQVINGGAGRLIGGGNQVYIPEVNPLWFGR